MDDALSRTDDREDAGLLPEEKAKPRRELVEPTFPRKLLGGYVNFRKNRLSRERERYEELASSGQKPDTMVVACCDSRSAPEVIFGAAPGEIFVVRNVANLMPPYDPAGAYHATSAALEFAVQELRVKHIVVMGHGRCGGIAAFRRTATGEATPPLSPGDFIGKWMSMLAPVAEKFDCTGADSAELLQRQLEEEAIRQSIAHLKTFPCVSILLEREQISLHGAWFDISSGELLTMNEETGVFELPFG
ncbi:carbonic anhydrase [Pseudahrensia aquimaris]|uniref:Carbonic anhydrase n=1 Tax=Pseudahrensia aquimaris TaxID=744461 RepID=A0ABW3FEL7_9HYPH